MRCGILLLAILLYFAAGSATAGEPTGVDATVLVFDTGLTSAEPDDTVFPAVRRVEALLWSYSLSQRLRASPVFDIVRIAARPDDLTELSISAVIAVSDGRRIALDVVVRDALGDEWLAQRFEGLSGNATLVMDSIARALEAKVLAQSTAERQRLREAALLRYGRRLAPSVFDDFFTEDDDGTLTLVRLPSRDDPMIERLLRLREATFLISDVIDEKFRELGSEVGDVYALWGDYLEQNRAYGQENLRRAEGSSSRFDAGTYEAYKRAYDLYKWHRQTVQEQDKLAVAFGNEVNPKLESIDERVQELLTWMDSKNAEWYRLLEALFEVETRRETG
ncbi:MAG: hypothetical protein AAGA44_02850 [Pseudomonadota bacterium]